MDLQTQRLMEGAAGAGGGAIGVEDVFKTYVWNSTNGNLTINNGIDLAGEDGLVLMKTRNSNSALSWYDTVRGTTKEIRSDASTAQSTESGGITAFNSNGFTTGTRHNGNGKECSSFTFRKAPGFFDIVTWTGNSSTTQTISHDLASIPGCIVAKSTSNDQNWGVYHRGLDSGNQPETHYLILNNNTGEVDDAGFWADSAPTATTFVAGSYLNNDGWTYVAYLFAHEEAEFGPNSDQKIISCGSYTGNGSSTGPEINNLGFEPAFWLVKRTDDSANWQLLDSMRGWVNGGNDQYLVPNSSTSEGSYAFGHPTPTGFVLDDSHAAQNASNGNYVYIAIAAETGKTSKVPENGSDVFAMDTGNSSSSVPSMDSNFSVDMAIYTQPASASHNWLTARLIGQKELKINGTDTEGVVSDSQWDSNVGWGISHNSNYQSWLWKRSAGFDCVAYKGTGDGSNTGPNGTSQNVAHNLGKSPEMIWVKCRSVGYNWYVYHIGQNGGTNPHNYYLQLNSSDAEQESVAPYTNAMWNNTAPTSTHFSLGPVNDVNDSTEDYIALLFTSVDGISSVGSYSPTSSSTTVTCGFQPRFVIVKAATKDNTWSVADSLRGITSGNDPALALNVDWENDKYGSADWIDVSATGFTVNSAGGAGTADANSNSETYIYYAHA